MYIGYESGSFKPDICDACSEQIVISLEAVSADGSATTPLFKGLKEFSTEARDRAGRTDYGKNEALSFDDVHPDAVASPVRSPFSNFVAMRVNPQSGRLEPSLTIEVALRVKEDNRQIKSIQKQVIIAIQIIIGKTIKNIRKAATKIQMQRATIVIIQRAPSAII